MKKGKKAGDFLNINLLKKSSFKFKMPELETITNSLAAGCKQLEPASFRTSAELTTERRTNKALRHI